jgi:hypothetical protein
MRACSARNRERVGGWRLPPPSRFGVEEDPQCKAQRSGVGWSGVPPCIGPRSRALTGPADQSLWPPSPPQCSACRRVGRVGKGGSTERPWPQPRPPLREQNTLWRPCSPLLATCHRSACGNPLPPPSRIIAEAARPAPSEAIRRTPRRTTARDHGGRLRRSKGGGSRGREGGSLGGEGGDQIGPRREEATWADRRKLWERKGGRKRLRQHARLLAKVQAGKRMERCEAVVVGGW